MLSLLRLMGVCLMAGPITVPLLLNAQVGIGTNAPHPSAVLELKSPSKGFLLPRMLNSNRLGIATPAHGLLVMDTTSTPAIYFWNRPASAWQRVGDNLGNHTATQNLDLSTYSLVGNGGSTGLSIAASGNVGINTTTPGSRLEVNGGLTFTPVSVAASNVAISIGPNVSAIRLTSVAGAQTNNITNFIGAEGQLLVIRNEDDDPATFTTFVIPPQQTGSFLYLNGAWREFSEATGGCWSLAGGNAGTNPGLGPNQAFLGTSDAKDLILATNGTDRLHILSNGNVGIGNASASSKLMVNGSMALNASTVVSGASLDISATGGDISTIWVTYNAVGGTCTITLPSAAACPGRFYYVKRSGATSAAMKITVTTPVGGGNVEGGAPGTGYSTTSAITRHMLIFQSDGANWWLMSSQ